ncbi:MAG: DMT family transporter [Candidatus Paceibacterota bacterium]
MFEYWIFLVLLAQFMNAVVVLVDRHLVRSPAIDKPIVYAFYVSVLSGVVILLLPFGVVLSPTIQVIQLSLLAGVSYTIFILLLYKSLKISDASDVAPVVGAVGALATFVFSLIFLGESLSGNFLLGFMFLVAGTFVMSYFRFTKKVVIFTILSGISFGISSVFIKDLFNQTTFWNGFFWSRMANVVVILLFMIWPSNFKIVWKNLWSSSIGAKSAVVANKVLAGFAFLLILYSINLGNVSVVNALGGMQFAFLLLLAFLFTKKFPEYFSESVHHGHVIAQKSVATVLIIFGLILLFR